MNDTLSTETEEPLPKHLLLTLNERSGWRLIKFNIRGKGSKAFLETLPSFHYGWGKLSYEGHEIGVRGKPLRKSTRARCASPEAINVWKDHEARAKWLLHHRAVSRLVPNL